MCQYPTCDKTIYHKNISNFFLRYPSIHLGNTLLVDDMPYRTYLNPSSNAIFVESYEDVLRKENYFLKTLLSYYKIFITLGLLFPPLWNSILLGP